MLYGTCITYTCTHYYIHLCNIQAQYTLNIRREPVQFSCIARPVFKSSVCKDGPRPWETLTSKGHFEVKVSTGSGIRDPQSEISQIEVSRADCRAVGICANTIYYISRTTVSEFFASVPSVVAQCGSRRQRL